MTNEGISEVHKARVARCKQLNAQKRPTKLFLLHNVHIILSTLEFPLKQTTADFLNQPEMANIAISNNSMLATLSTNLEARINPDSVRMSLSPSLSLELITRTDGKASIGDALR